MDNKLSDLTVIILTFKTDKSILINCLKSIDSNVKVMIVENSKTFDNSKDIQDNFSNVKIITTGSNLGMGAGNNFGMQNVKTKYVLILNPDIICDKNFFINVNKYLDESIDYAVIGCQYYNNDIYKPAGFFLNNKNNTISFKNELTPVDWIVGCSMLLNMNKFKDNKIFDENYFLFFEEFDLCRRLIKDKFKIYSSNKLIVDHLGFKGSFASDKKYKIEAIKLRNWHYMWSQFYFNRKYDGIFLTYYKGFFKLIKIIFKFIYFFIVNKNEEKIKYKYRFLGLINSMLMKKSHFRIDF